jgi:hypothetical protein
VRHFRVPDCPFRKNPVASPTERPVRLIVNGTSPGIASVGDVVENVQQFV